MKANLKKILVDHKERLEGLLIHRDVPQHIAAYIREFLLNKEFCGLVDEISQVEDGTQRIDQ